MRIFNLNIFRQQYPKRRFGELFNPTVLNFGFWIATATFLFFWYDIFARRAEMSPIDNFGTTFLEIVSNIALGAGFICFLSVVYLFVTWMWGIRIKRHKTTEKELTDIDYSIEALESRVFNLIQQLNILNERIAVLRKEIQNKNEVTTNNSRTT